MELIFWLSFAFLAYIFIGYPLLLSILARRSDSPVRKGPIEPTVTVVIAARSDESGVAARLQNILNQDYPHEKVQIIVTFDGAGGNESVVRQYGTHGVEFMHSRFRVGKPGAINAAIPRITGEIVVFADARQTFDLQAVRNLVYNFADSRVGSVSGELILLDNANKEAAGAVGLYWRYEKKIRSMESRLRSTVGATGAIYAIRRELLSELQPNTILDDVVIPMRTVLAGKRTVFEPEAKAFDVVSCCPAAEYQRKVRTLTGNFQLLTLMPQLLNPFRNPVWWQFMSHKVGRLLVPYALIALFVSNAVLVEGIFYRLIFAAQSVWYALAMVGYAEGLREAGQPLFVLPPRKRAA